MHHALAFPDSGAGLAAGTAVLLLASIAAAFGAWRTDPLQRGFRHVGLWLLRLAAGMAWWLHHVPNEGWTDPGFALADRAVAGVVAVSFAAGLFTRLGALLGAAVVIGLAIRTPAVAGQMVAPLLLQLAFVLDPPGRSLGLDAILLRRQARVLPFNWRRARRPRQP